MQRRQITLADGRYLIFYTFDEETVATANPNDDAGAGEAAARRAQPQPDVEPQATEEKRV